MEVRAFSDATYCLKGDLHMFLRGRERMGERDGEISSHVQIFVPYTLCPHCGVGKGKF